MFCRLLVLIAILFGSVQPLMGQEFLTGYARHWTNLPGEAADFHLNGITPDENAVLHVYDVFHNSVATIEAPLRPQSTASGITKAWEEGVGFESQSLMIPELPHGIYRLDGPELTSHAVPFLIGDPVNSAPADIVVIYPTNTVNAYSRTDGVNLYQKLADGIRPPEVSFLRPQESKATPRKLHRTRGLDRLLTEMDYTVNYIADSDLESYDAIAGSKLVIIPGHSEYWTATARRNFDRFIDNGGSGLVLSGNTMYRAVGYDDPADPTVMTFPKRQAFTQDALGYQTYESIGVDFYHGGNGSGWDAMRDRIDMFYDGWKVLDASPSYLANEGIEAGQVIHDPAAEFDGAPFLSCDPTTGPVIDNERLGFHRFDLIAFENTTSDGKFPGCATWIDFTKTRDSGRIITVPSVTAAQFTGQSGELKKAITSNMIELLLIEQADFNGDEVLSTDDIDVLSFATLVAPAPLRFDLNEDNVVDQHDVSRWINDFADTIHGDANLDGAVSFADFLILNENFGADFSLWSQGDFNSDGSVDFADFLTISTNFGYRRPTMASAIATVPEPSGGFFLPFVVIGLPLLFRLDGSRQFQRRCVPA